MGVHQGVGAGQGFKFVGGCDQGQTGESRQLCRHGLGIARRRVQAGADRRAAQGQLTQMGQGGAHMGLTVLELRHVARELLPQRERRGVLQMGAANLHDVGKVA